METREKLEQEIKDLQRALKSKLIGVNDYCTMVHSLYKRLEKLKNQ